MGWLLRQQVKTGAAVLAILAIALHTMLWTMAASLTAASAGFDPFSVICHSGSVSSEADDQNAGQPASKPTSACDHCNLCSAAEPASAPDVVILGRLIPERVLALLSPSSVSRRDGVTSNPKLARGPPQQA